MVILLKYINYVIIEVYSMEYNPEAKSVLSSSCERWIGSGGAYNYTPDAPTRDADQLIGKKIIRSGVESLITRRFSQTPLAPEGLIDMGLRYGDVVGNVLEQRIIERADKLQLSPTFTDAVRLEVQMELGRRIKGNSDAAHHLYREIHGTEVSENDAELIWRARTGDATLADTGQLLLRYPMMQSIEAAKYTEPFFANIDANMQSHIMKGLSGFAHQISHPSRLSMHIYKPGDERRDTHYMDVVQDGYDDETRTLLSSILPIKEAVAEVSDGHTTIQLVSKHTNIMLPADLDLSGSLHYSHVTTIGDKRVNVLPIAISSYWRIKQPADARSQQ